MLLHVNCGFVCIFLMSWRDGNVSIILCLFLPYLLFPGITSFCENTSAHIRGASQTVIRKICILSSDEISGKQEEWQWPLQSTTKETIPRICLPDLKTTVIGVFVIIMISCHLCLQLSLLGFAALAYHFMFLLLPHTNKHTKLINYYMSLCCSFKITVSYKHWISIPHNCNLQILAQWVETCHLEVRDSMCQECFIPFKRGKQMHHFLHCEQRHL
jgi:hypothetical protein